MVHKKHTAQLKGLPELQVTALEVKVVGGPGAGASCIAESDVVTVGSAPGNDLQIDDEAVSRYHLELTSTSGGVDVRDLGSTNGTCVGQTRIHHAVVALGRTLRLGESTIAVSDGGGLFLPVHAGELPYEVVGDTSVMRRLMALVERAASTRTSTLIVGESGTGKEVVARAIHALSSRAQAPFVTVDCGAFAPTLIASELFGHERGAFTGADRRHEGAFERAAGGTIFLDEIGELPVELQPQLLGVLERQRFRRLGGRDEIATDVRVLAATNRDLREEVNKGSFRLDLYYRLAVVMLRLPPLRDRMDDLPRLLDHFLREGGHEGARTEVVSDAVMQQLMCHRWPGNVRELRNWVEATLAMGEATELHGTAEPPSGESDVVGAVLGMPYKVARNHLLDIFEKRYVERIVAQCDGNVSRAARTARIDRTYLIRLLSKHGLR